MRQRLIAATALSLAALITHGSCTAQGDARRGEYITKAAGCVGCHTDTAAGSAPFAGGRAISSPFGTFYGPNITPHPQAGIGRWREEDLVRALRTGVAPDGGHYYPAFPYTSFALMTDGDIQDVWAFLRTLKPNDRRNRRHDLSWFANWRPVLGVWKRLFFNPAATRHPVPAATARGAYLTDALGHCGECHTPRNALGALQHDRYLAGAKDAKGHNVPNLTPTRLKKWNDAELAEFLVTGITPDMDSADEAMAEVVRNTTSQLTKEDLAALIAYLRGIPPLPEQK